MRMQWKSGKKGRSPPFLRPLGGNTQRLTGRHRDEGERLAGGDQRDAVGLADHFESAPETGASEFIEAAPDGDPVAEARRAFVINLGAGDDRENLGLGHRQKVHSHESGKACAASFDHPQVSEIMDDSAAVGIEKHDFFAGFKGRHGTGHGKTSQNLEKPAMFA